MPRSRGCAAAAVEDISALATLTCRLISTDSLVLYCLHLQNSVRRRRRRRWGVRANLGHIYFLKTKMFAAVKIELDYESVRL